MTRPAGAATKIVQAASWPCRARTSGPQQVRAWFSSSSVVKICPPFGEVNQGYSSRRKQIRIRCFLNRRSSARLRWCAPLVRLVGGTLRCLSVVYVLFPSFGSNSVLDFNFKIAFDLKTRSLLNSLDMWASRAHQFHTAPLIILRM